MNQKLKENILESLASVLPITFIVLALSIFFVPIELGTIVMFFVGALLLVAGMGFFQLGAEMAMTPLGKGIGIQVAKSRKVAAILLTGLAIGTIATLAEPDLQVLATQVPSIPNKILVSTVAVGVGLFLALSMLRILLRINLSLLLTILYAGVIALSFFIPKNFMAVAFDSGGVTTGPITVPFIVSMGVGLSYIRSDKNAPDDSFGLISLASIGPIFAVMLLGLVYPIDDTVYSGSVTAIVETTRDVAKVFGFELPAYALDVLISILPILAVFLLFQLLSRRFRSHQLGRMLIGFLYTIIGLTLFLCGVDMGFSPVGTMLGRELANSAWRWMLIPVGVLIGYYIVKAEPAVQVLNKQVQNVTNGAISVRTMNLCLSIGVSVSSGLAMLRVLVDVPIQYILIPGYSIALILSWFVPKMFTGIAFDSGGVASGSMTTAFLLPLGIGVCEVLGGNVMMDAFGVVALVALTPVIAVLIMGLIYRFRTDKMEESSEELTAVPLTDDEIVEF